MYSRIYVSTHKIHIINHSLSQCGEAHTLLKKAYPDQFHRWASHIFWKAPSTALCTIYAARSSLLSAPHPTHTNTKNTRKSQKSPETNPSFWLTSIFSPRRIWVFCTSHPITSLPCGTMRMSVYWSVRLITHHNSIVFALCFVTTSAWHTWHGIRLFLCAQLLLWNTSKTIAFRGHVLQSRPLPSFPSVATRSFRGALNSIQQSQLQIRVPRAIFRTASRAKLCVERTNTFYCVPTTTTARHLWNKRICIIFTSNVSCVCMFVFGSAQVMIFAAASRLASYNIYVCWWRSEGILSVRDMRKGTGR